MLQELRIRTPEEYPIQSNIFFHYWKYVATVLSVPSRAWLPLSHQALPFSRRLRRSSTAGSLALSSNGTKRGPGLLVLPSKSKSSLSLPSIIRAIVDRYKWLYKGRGKLGLGGVT